jgi:hypothetical protein
MKIQAAVIAALVIAAVSTLGDFIWATWIPRHRPVYGLAHGALLFLCIGAVIGGFAGKRLAGALVGALIGFLAAGSFYALSPLTGFWSMFVIWFAVWIALGVFHGRLNDPNAGVRSMVLRGLLAAIAFGAAFYLISGIWFPFRPRGWDYAAHFAGWTFAYAAGFIPLFIRRFLKMG